LPGVKPRTRIMKPLRRFNMADAMVMIAATAVAIAFIQYQGLPWILAEKWFPPKDNILRPPEDGDLAVLISSFLIPWTVALLFLHFRRPRPSRGRLFMRPGFVACAIVIAMMVFICLDEYRQNVFAYRSFMAPSVQTVVALNYRISIFFAVAGLWMLMAACGRWHAEPSWIDRAGRAVGTLWIILIPIRWFSPY
jgi:hypothetical protein